MSEYLDLTIKLNILELEEKQLKHLIAEYGASRSLDNVLKNCQSRIKVVKEQKENELKRKSNGE